MPLKDIDSLMTLKKFTRYDTSAGNLLFRFYSYSRLAGNVAEVRYLQLAIKPDDSYAEIQYQTSAETESLQWQHQLKNSGFKKNTPDHGSFYRYDFLILYSAQSTATSTIIFYTFSIRENKQTDNKNLFRQTRFNY